MNLQTVDKPRVAFTHFRGVTKMVIPGNDVVRARKVSGRLPGQGA
jgi:hypothetical protein